MDAINPISPAFIAMGEAETVYLKTILLTMKISINSTFVETSYGGGMQFANFMRDFLEQKGVSVVNTLHDNDIDLILHVNPFPFLTRASMYSFWDAYAYKLLHPKTVIVHRVNECDERKGTSHINKYLVKARSHSDYVVYISEWLREVLTSQAPGKNEQNSVIFNGADTRIFYSDKNKHEWDGERKLKVVTHHWGAHRMKGHDIYECFDELLSEREYRENFEFTFVGKIPKDVEYRNTTVLSPRSGKELARELRQHDVYLTASQNEPAGMHHIEGALCGMPLLFRDSGALPEYCKGFGIKFNTENFQEKLNEMHKNYSQYSKKMSSYPHTAEKMGREYFTLFDKLISHSDEFRIKNRKPIIAVLKARGLFLYSKIYFLFYKLVCLIRK